jgi:hypothetical protein
MAVVDHLWVDHGIGDPMLDDDPGPEHVTAGHRDVVFAAPKSVSVYYAALRGAKRYDEVEVLLDAHEEAVLTALRYLNRKAAEAAVPTGPSLEDMLAAEPNALPERRRELEIQSMTMPTLSTPSRGLRITQLMHIQSAPPNGRDFGDPHVHTHALIDPRVTSQRDGQRYPLDKSLFNSEVTMAQGLYEVDLTERMMRDLPVRFMQSHDTGRREMTGISPESMAAFPYQQCHPFPGRQYQPESIRLAA